MYYPDRTGELIPLDRVDPDNSTTVMPNPAIWHKPKPTPSTSYPHNLSS